MHVNHIFPLVPFWKRFLQVKPVKEHWTTSASSPDLFFFFFFFDTIRCVYLCSDCVLNFTCNFTSVTNIYIVMWMQEGRKWHFEWNWVFLQILKDQVKWQTLTYSVGLNSKYLHIYGRNKMSKKQRNTKEIWAKNGIFCKTTKMHLRPSCIQPTIYDFLFFQ